MVDHIQSAWKEYGGLQFGIVLKLRSRREIDAGPVTAQANWGAGLVKKCSEGSQGVVSNNRPSGKTQSRKQLANRLMSGQGQVENR